MGTAELAERWRSTWERAWAAKDGAAIEALYADEAVYRSGPFREPERSARDYVDRVFGEEEAVECRFGDDGLVTQHTDYWAQAEGRVSPFAGWGS